MDMDGARISVGAHILWEEYMEYSWNMTTWYYLYFYAFTNVAYNFSL